MNRFLMFLVMLWTAALTIPASAQNYPQRPIRLVIGLAAGGPSDVMARTVAQELGDRLGQQVVVDNKPGVGGNLAADLVAKSPPDGYTLFFTSTGPLAVSPSLFSKLPYDPIKDFSPVGLVANLPLVLFVPATLPVRNLDDLLASARARPGQLMYASAGNGATTHLAMELLKSAAGVDIQHVPYKGTAAAMPDLISGQVHAMLDGWSGSEPMVKAGKLRAIAVAVDKRISVAPDLPTIAESGFPGFNASPWYGIVAPAGTPKAVIERLSKELKATMAAASVRTKFATLGMEPLSDSPDEFAEFIKSETTKWAKVVKVSGAKVD